MTVAFDTQLAKSAFQGNIVLEIDGVYYSQYPVDTGLAVDADKVGLISNVTVNGVTLDIRNVRTSIASVSFSMVDKDERISISLGNSSQAWQNFEVKTYMGFITGTFDFADYTQLATTRIKAAKRLDNGWRFTSAEPIDLAKKRISTTFANLDGAISDIQTSINLDDATSFASTGTAKIGSEFITWSGKTVNTLTGVTRGVLSSTGTAHTTGTDVFVVTTRQDAPLTMLVDILQTEMAIPASLIDLTGIALIESTFFVGEGDYLLYLYDIADGLKWLEDNILLPTNTRFITKEGKISLAILDQVDFSVDAEEFDEDTIREGRPNYSIDSNRIVNKVIVKWNWSEGLASYTRTNTFTDDDSIATYGERNPLTLNFKGVQAALGGNVIVTDRANRLLARLSTPKAEISLSTHVDKFNTQAGDTVRVSHRFIPSQGAGLGFSDLLEVVSRAPGQLATDANIKWKLQFTSFTGIRVGLIAPSPLLDGVIASQKEFDVPDGGCYRVGYKLVLWNEASSIYYPDAANEILAISGNTLTMKDLFVTTLGAGVRLKFADYDESSVEQKARYGYIAPNTGVFVSDGANAYEIII